MRNPAREIFLARATAKTKNPQRTLNDSSAIVNSSIETSETSQRLSAWEWLVVAIGSAALFANTVTSTPLKSANDRSRWSTVWALVHRGTYQIDEIDQQSDWRTIDKVRHDEHFYSSKPPILATVTAGVYWGVHHATGLDLYDDPVSTTRLVLLIVNWLPTSIAFIVMGRLLLRCSHNEFVRTLALAAFCLGSLVPSYATTLNNHSVAAVCLVFSLAYMFRIVVDRCAGDSEKLSHEPRGSDYLWAGFWAALVPCNELPAALFGIAAFVSVLRVSRKQTLRWFIPGALIPLVAYFVLNGVATGGWKPFYLDYGTEKYRFVHEGIPSYWMNPRGLDQNLDSPIVYFMHCVVGHHGIFSLSPIFVLLFCSLKCRAECQTLPTRAVLWFCMGLSAVVLGFYLTRTSNYNYGGNSFGLRWMVWLTPFWILALVPALEWCVERRSRLVVTFLLLGVSVFSSLTASRNPWGESWLFYQMKTAGWIDYSDPAPTFPFTRQLHTWFSELPRGEKPGAWVEFTSSGSATDTLGRRLDNFRMTDKGEQTKQGKRTREIEFKFMPAAGAASTINLWFDIDAFYAGESVSKSVIAFEATSGQDWQQVYTLLRGIPTQRAYQPSLTRYLKTVLQNDYLTCQRAAAQVTEDWNGQRIRFRSDTWLCKDVPFGVAQFEWSEHDSASGQQLSLQRYVISAAGE